MLWLLVGRTLIARLRDRMEALEKPKERSTDRAETAPPKHRSIAMRPSLAMIRALREARYFGVLVERNGEIYSARGDQPLCSQATIDALVDRGWLRRRRSRYTITNAGKLAERDLAP
jgi:hypothetical protein